jgi:putative sigma-54 modulation protein
MNVTINGQNVKISDALEEFTRKKLDKLDRYLPNIAEIRVDIARQNTRRGEPLSIAQITLRHRRGAILRAEEKLRSDERDSIQAAINLAVDKMYRRIERFKGKRQRKGSERFTATIEELGVAEATPVPESAEAEVADIEAAATDGDIVRRKEINVVAMTETEAVDQMELLGHNFFVFYNADAGKINVLYRRDDGGYGLLIPNIS